LRVLVADQRGAIDQQRRARRRALTSVAEFIRLSMGSVTLWLWSSMCAGVEAVGLVQRFSIDQLVEDEEQAVGVDRAGVEVVVAIFRIVEVEAAELPELDQPGRRSSRC
jgi:hypothetical protein